jgi:hypothetical protein
MLTLAHSLPLPNPAPTEYCRPEKLFLIQIDAC